MNYRETTDSAKSVIDRGDAVLMRTYGRYPVQLVSGQGAHVTDIDGRDYLDFLAGIAVNGLGHRHPAVLRAIHQAAEGLIHVSNLYWTEPMVTLAERLCELSGMSRAFFCNSGAESIETAIKWARKARPGRTKLVCFERSFHGRTMGSLSLTAQPKYQKSFLPVLAGIEVIPWGTVEALEAIDETTAGVFVEVVQGEGGVRPAPDGWLPALRERCDRVGALLVLDEVQTGVGRTGTLWAFEQDGIVPDAITLAKALANGLPIGVLLARGTDADAFVPADHGATFGGGPFVTTVASTVLDVVTGPGFLGDVVAKGAQLGAGLSRIAEAHPAVASGERGRGLMRGLVLRAPIAGELVKKLIPFGVLTAPASPDVLRFVPPLVVQPSEIDEALTRIGAMLTRYEADPNS